MCHAEAVSSGRFAGVGPILPYHVASFIPLLSFGPACLPAHSYSLYSLIYFLLFFAHSSFMISRPISLVPADCPFFSRSQAWSNKLAS